MSLKTFHIAFIIVSATLAFGFSVWLVKMYLENNGAMYITGSAFSFLAGVGLIVYGIRFLKKLKHVSFF